MVTIPVRIDSRGALTTLAAFHYAYTIAAP
jgi:hypothetical protein